VIEEYEVLERPKDSDNERYSDIKTGNGLVNEMALVDDLPEDRAPSQPMEERSPQDLRDRASEAKKKYEEEQKGSEQPRDENAETMYDNDRAGGPSDSAPSDQDQMQRQQQEKKKYVEELERPKQPKDESASTMYDNDRPSGPSDSAPSDQDQMERQREEKKKSVEEQKLLDKDNDRP